MVSVFNQLVVDSLLISANHKIGFIVTLSILILLIIKELSVLVPGHSSNLRFTHSLEKCLGTGLVPLLMVFALIVVSRVINAFASA